MYLESVKLRNFRNYRNETVDFTEGMNVIVGDNGEGKTNLLESIYLLSTTRSHRNDDDKELIQFEEEFASIEGTVVYKDDRSKLTAILHKNGKTIMINNQPVRKNSEFIGRLNAVLFEPGDMDFFDDAPKIRRRMVDMELGKLSLSYMHSLSDYLKSLKERNAYLKGNIDDVMLDTYTEMLYEPQIRIIKERNEFINKINSYLSYFYNEISGENHSIKMHYRSIVEEKNDEEKMKQTLSQIYANNRERDIYLKVTNNGIHREDYLFSLDGNDVSKYCSQGQKRMVLLALKMAIVQIIFQVKREFPVLLLDDVFSELDAGKRKNLYRLLPQTVQTIITTTDSDEIDVKENVKLIQIRKGMVINGKQR